MKRATGQVNWKTVVVWGALLALSVDIGRVLAAAEEITGDWEITMDMGGRQSFATLIITKKTDGTLTGTWGRTDLSNVKFDGQKLTFVRTMKFGDQEFPMNYTGTLKDGKLTGSFSTEQGDMAANGARKKPKCPALGQWDLSYKVQDQDIAAKLIITQKADGSLDAKWTSAMGESTVSNVKFQDNKLSLSRTVKFNDNSFDMTFEGAIKDNKLTGTNKSDMGEIEVTGVRSGAALIGKWDLTINAEQGTFTGMLIVEPDLTARYDFFGGEIPAKDLKFDGTQLSFKVSIGFGDQDSDMEFKAKIDGKTLKGQQVSQFGTADVTGKKMEPAPATPAAPAAAAAPAKAPSPAK
jgi:hypothetical protein